MTDQTAATSEEARPITLDDLFRIAYKHGGRVELFVGGGHSTRHTVSYEGLLYELEYAVDRKLLLELAS